MTDITRDEFIKAVREIRPPMFSAPERQGFFLRNLDGEFTAPGLEAAYVGWMLANASTHDALESDETTRLDPSTGHVEMRVAASVSSETPWYVDWQVWPAALPQGTKLYYHPPQCTDRTSTGGE